MIGMQTLFRILIVSAVVSLASSEMPSVARSRGLGPVATAPGSDSVAPGAIAARQPAPSVFGTWKGDSTCRGNRPACKNEVVVYRFEAVAGKPDAILWFADKIVEGKREPMGKAKMHYDQAKGELSWEFTVGQNHGLWQFKASVDTMEGTLVLLPNRELVRVVKVKRINENDVPPAP